MSKKLAVGNSVKLNIEGSIELKSTGPTMTVVATPNCTSNLYTCEWYPSDKPTNLQTANFSADVLRKVS
ncbi:DUF2158 domain-containing protein [Marinomonas transparens]|uniref:DUF2158 domain-containing protein n=1 Tax=Marinomonas transparens TaxID=2795388 RepID=A0A934JMK5_9GAMM|nr:DUF2158 domain-containing protein [Marinomonas transparens]